MSKPLFILASCIVLFACAKNSSPVNSAGHTNAGEVVLAKPKVNWRLVTDSPGIKEYVPKEQTEHNWTEMMTFITFDLVDQDVNALADQYKNNSAAFCKEQATFKNFNGKESGYPVAVWFHLCSSNNTTLQGEITLYKAIQGHDGLYLVMHAARVPAFRLNDKNLPMKDETIKEWLNDFSSVVVCDTRISDSCSAGINK